MRAPLLVLLAIGCTEPKAAAPPPTRGVCHDGAMLGGEEIACDDACVRTEKGPRCVAIAEAAEKEPCGKVACGSGCSCASDTPNACICPKLGPP